MRLHKAISVSFFSFIVCSTLLFALTGETKTHHVTSDNDGNIIVVGSFDNGLIIDNQLVEGSDGQAGVFAAKWSGDGDLEWNCSITQIPSDVLISVTVLEDNSIILSGVDGYDESEDQHYMVKLTETGEIDWMKLKQTSVETDY